MGAKWSRRFLAYHPVHTFGEPCGRIFRDNSGLPAFNSWPESGRSSPDLAALFDLGEKAWNLLPKRTEVESFEKAMDGYFSFVDAVREGLIERIEGGIATARDQHGNQVEGTSWLDEYEPSELVSVGWGVATSAKGLADDEVRNMFLEVFAISTLLEIDNALVALHLEGGSAVASALAASEAYANAHSIATRDDQLQNARKELAAQAAAHRHQNDPKQREKRFVYECWSDWRNGLRSYKGKAAFARDMIQKCEHLISVKKIEDWVREWDKDRSPGHSAPK